MLQEQVDVKEVERFLEEISSEGRKEGRNGTSAMSALHSILHGWLAQVNDILVVFGGAGFGTKAILNRRLRERVTLGLTLMFPKNTGVRALGPRTGCVIGGR